MAPPDSFDAWCMTVLGAPQSHFADEDAPGRLPVSENLAPPFAPILPAGVPAAAAAPPAAVAPPPAAAAPPPAPAPNGPGNRKVTDGKAAPEDAKANKSGIAGAKLAIKAQDWAKAATALTVVGEAAMLKLVRTLPKPSVKKLHDAAVADISIGQNSPLALATVAIDDAPLGKGQSDRASALEKKMSPEDQKKLHVIMDGKKPPKELDYLQKGLAAGHTIKELEAFSRKIAGKDEKWMQDNLSLTGDSKGKGVKQQWSMSCNATTVQAVKGQLDPIYALKLHEENSDLSDANDKDATKKNKKLGAEQKAMLEKGYADGKAGGQARSRGDRTAARGRWNTDLLNDNTGSTGLTYGRERMDTPEQLEAGVTAINEAVGKKLPVPLVVGDGATKKNAHYVLITGTDPGPPRYYSIHDPATGDTVVRSEDQLRKGELNLAGWNKVAAFEKPTQVEVQ